MWNIFNSNGDTQVYLVPVTNFKNDTKNQFMKRFSEWFLLIPYKTAFSPIFCMKILLSSWPYIILLSSQLVSCKLRRVFGLPPLIKISKWKDNFVYDLSILHKFFDNEFLFLCFISDVDVIFDYEYIILKWQY